MNTQFNLIARAIRRPLPEILFRWFGPMKVGLDLLAWAFALYSASVIRLEIAGYGISVGTMLRAIGFVCGAQLGFGWVFGLYRGGWRYGGFDEVAALSRTAVAASASAVAFELFFQPRIPLSAVIIGSAFALLLMVFIRYSWRLVSELRRRPDVEGASRLLIYGAGDRGFGIVNDLLSDTAGSYLPVAFIDDDPTKQRLSIRGVPVRGTRSDLALVAREYRADSLLVAMASVSAELIREVSSLADRCNPPLTVKVLSPLNNLFGTAEASQIQDLTEEDLLGRRRVDTDMEGIAAYIRDKRVLVTGAGGSIGSELCRQLTRFKPAQLLMLDRDESALHSVQLAIEGRAMLDSPDVILADLRDSKRIHEIFQETKPHVVFHAAALKHLPLLESYPAEAVKSNVWGTWTVLEAAMASGVESFVNISTDKAADPMSVLGYSKRLAERLTAFAARTTSTGTYVSVRFGNVLGSRGSVLHTFRDQIKKGGPITLTHPDITRYFMLIPEAVQLVIQAGAIGRPGEVLVLDMGVPVKIASMADALIRRSRRSIEIVFTGLRDGEKLHEDLLGVDEVDARPLHPLITHAAVPWLSPKQAHSIDLSVGADQLRIDLKDMCDVDGQPSC